SLLPLLTLADWREDHIYDERPPICVHYSLEWKLTVNGRSRTKDMEQDVVLAPSAIWMRALRPNLQKIVDTKLSSNKTYRAAETSVTVHVSDRAERDLTKRFDGLDIDWAVLENQLVAWSRLFRAGKRLRLTMEFKYIEKGGKLETHGDVPQFIREQLKAAKQNVSNRKRKRDESPVRALPPININVSSSPHAADTSGIWATEPLGPKNVERLNIPGLREDILQYYTMWHQSRVRQANLKSEFSKANDLTLESGFSLDQVHRDQNPAFYTEQGVKPGIARSYVEDIPGWVE
ncbi:hypothetical protein BKA67DRAFT_503644, partial [Truncatella angustata]